MLAFANRLTLPDSPGVHRQIKSIPLTCRCVAQRSELQLRKPTSPDWHEYSTYNPSGASHQASKCALRDRHSLAAAIREITDGGHCKVVFSYSPTGHAWSAGRSGSKITRRVATWKLPQHNNPGPGAWGGKRNGEERTAGANKACPVTPTRVLSMAWWLHHALRRQPSGVLLRFAQVTRACFSPCSLVCSLSL